MIWATVSSQSCVCWLDRASPSLAAKNIINLISVLHSVLQGQICPLLQVFLDLFCIPVPLMKRTSFWGVSSKRSCRSSQNHSTLASSAITSRHIDLDYCDMEWFALETNRDHSVIFEIASKYCISDSFVDHNGYSISSEGFLPTAVDIMVIWVKFTHSSPF